MGIPAELIWFVALTMLYRRISLFYAKIKYPIEGIKISVTVERKITNTLAAGRHTWTRMYGIH